MENARRAQRRLVRKGYNIEVDGDFGPASMAALMCYVGRKSTVTLLRQELGRAADREFFNVEINTALRVAHALAQQSVETGGYSRLVESMNYSVAGLKSTFSRRRISTAQCNRLGRKSGEPALSRERQEKIANLVYGGDFGKDQLGNTKTGDGWKYRGRGIKQTTGRYNYGDVKKITGIDVVRDPSLLADPDLGVRAGCIFWQSKNCNKFADADDITGLTKRINGGTNGLEARRAALKRAKAILL